MVSIIIPVYNREYYIGDALQSAISQTWRDLEIIVVDDGSTDGTCKVVESFLHDQRVVYTYQKNSGRPAIARNTGLALAHGEYACFLDSDDILPPDSVESRVRVLETNKDLGFVCADWLDFVGDFCPENLSPSWVAEVLSYLPAHVINRRLPGGIVYTSDFIFELFHNHIISAGTVMVRRALLEKSGFFDPAMTIGEDRDLWFRLATLAPFCFLSAPLCYIRTHIGNITVDRMQNLAADVRVLCKFLAATSSRKEKWKPLYPRLADYFANAGWHLLNADLYDPAKEALRKAFRYRVSPKTSWYALLTLLPNRTIGRLRGIKRRLVASIARQENALQNLMQEDVSRDDERRLQ